MFSEEKRRHGTQQNDTPHNDVHRHEVECDTQRAIFTVVLSFVATRNTQFQKHIMQLYLQIL